VRIARREARTREETLLDRVERIERKLDTGGPVVTSASSAPAPPPPAGGPMLAPRARPPKTAPTAEADPVAEPASTPSPVAPPPDPAPPTASAPTAPAPTMGLDDVIEAWPDTLGLLKAPLRAAIQDAQPIAIDEHGVIVFGVPKRRFDAINERFRKEASTIKDAFTQQLGGSPRFILRPHDMDAPDALRPGPDARGTVVLSAPSAGDHQPDHDHDVPVDLDELVDATDAPPPDSVSRLVANLGAEVVEERPRA